MLLFISPTGNLKPPTQGELTVLYWLFVLVMTGLGVVLLYLSFGQPPEKHLSAMIARWLGSLLTLVGIGPLILNWARNR